MLKHEYLNWMASETDSNWTNDSAIIDEIMEAKRCGAIGCTTNPPLSYEALTATNELYKDEVSNVSADLKGNDRVLALIGIVVRRISNIFYEMYEEGDGQKGYVRSQVEPNLSSDAKAMLNMGKHIASWGKNIMVKIPVTSAGVWVLEELAALGIPTTPTVAVSVSQIVASAKANERGIERAIKNNIKPAPSTAAFVMGRLQDYLIKINDERNTGLSIRELELAALAAAKKCCKIYAERGYKQRIMPAAFRCADHVTQLVGADIVMTIHPKVQAMVIKADKEGTINREVSIHKPVDSKIIEKVSNTLPEFAQAYSIDSIAIKNFDTFGATLMTLDGFNTTGWQRLHAL